MEETYLSESSHIIFERTAPFSPLGSPPNTMSIPLPAIFVATVTFPTLPA